MGSLYYNFIRSTCEKGLEKAVSEKASSCVDQFAHILNLVDLLEKEIEDGTSSK